ncbi:MAG TPA: FtsX-like permease family protein [Lachnospiraceae bacterium]|nr:FtsX-like permease family protein [Lachnospiraceae bacterium]
MMRILMAYTLDYVKRNRKSSIPIIAAIIIATTLLSAYSGYLYTEYTNGIRQAILHTGNWHAELFSDTSGSKLKYVTGHPNVESVMIKGPEKIAKIEDSYRPYFLLRGLTSNYWNDMEMQDLILEGRVPHENNELAISKQYFENHPELNIGDSITLPIGDRTFNDEVLEQGSIWQAGEIFQSKEEQTYTVVGKLDATTNSMTPAYIAYGFMDEDDILPNDQLTVYMRFHNPRKAYKDIISIAKLVGYQIDEYGNYPVRENRSLLSAYYIFPPDADLNLWQFSQLLVYTLIALMIVIVFSVVIQFAFSMSSQARMRQFGILQSIGASPKQMKQSVIYEVILLSVISIPIGLLLGWFLDKRLFEFINSVKTDLENDTVFTFGLPALLPSILLALLTVWLSAILPTRRITKLSPIDAIRQGNDSKIGKVKNHRITSKLFGIEGELALNALHARKRSYLTATVSLTLSLLLFSTFFTLTSISDASNIIVRKDRTKEEYDLVLRTMDGMEPDYNLKEQILSIKGVTDVLLVSNSTVSLRISKDMQSDELLLLGGLERIEESKKYPIYEDNDHFVIRSQLIALDDESFNNYCDLIGTDSAQFYNADTPCTIVINQVQDDIHSNRRKDVCIPFLKLNKGDKLSCEERTNQGDTGDNKFSTKVGFLTQKLPPIETTYNNFELLQIMPRSEYVKVIENFDDRKLMVGRCILAPVKVSSAEYVSSVDDKIHEICDRRYASGDYLIKNFLELRESQAAKERLFKTVMLCISIFFAMIGLINVFATVSGNLIHRRKEFAILRSIGISPPQMNRMLTLEALFFGVLPILLNIPVNIIVIWIFLHINVIYLSEYLPYLPILPIGAFRATILIVIVIAYAFGRKGIEKHSIIDVIRDDEI